MTAFTWAMTAFTWDARAADAAFAVPMHRLAALLDHPVIEPVPVPRDCTDGFGAAFWSRLLEPPGCF
jgi:hypothetical protein